METTNGATTFTMICECFRCAGFKRAFSTFAGINDGRCLRCNGTLRDLVTKPIARLAEYAPNARAESIATIARVLELVGAPAVYVDGKRVSPWRFAYVTKADDCIVFAAALSIAPEAVRVRGWAAFAAKVRATLGDRAEGLLAATRKRVVAFTGLTTETVGAWLGEAAEAERVAA